jgi:MerR family transcriptional regulator, thiopeptide resistance regulator
MSTKTYTVSQVSRLAHVTVRTLHHYDEIGLLVPSQRENNGYRRYTDADLQRLHQILLFKELGFALDAIAAVIDEPPSERRSALLSQREKLEGEQRKTAAVLRAIETAIQALEGDTTMDANKVFDGFENFDHAKYADEARQRWGHTEAYRESERRTKRYTKEDWSRIKAEGDAINKGMAELLLAGASPADSAAMDLAEQHRLHIDRWFYPCTHEVQVALGEMYVADTRFTETYDKYAPGLAHFMRDAIKANAAR